MPTMKTEGPPSAIITRRQFMEAASMAVLGTALDSMGAREPGFRPAQYPADYFGRAQRFGDGLLRERHHPDAEPGPTGFPRSGF